MNGGALGGELPLIVYRQVFDMLAVSAFNDAFHTISPMVLQEVLTYLDPDRRGVVLSILRCTPPVGANSIRSLYSQITQGTPPWIGEVVQHMLFFGVESLASRTVQTGQVNLVMDIDAADTRHPFVAPKGARSLACHPIRRFGRWAGVFAVASAFSLSSHHSQLLQEAALLIGLTIPHQELYSIERISFCMMPPPQVQFAVLSTYRSQLLKAVKLGRQSGQSLNIDQAKHIVLQKLEEELLDLVTFGKQLDSTEL